MQEIDRSISLPDVFNNYKCVNNRNNYLLQESLKDQEFISKLEFVKNENDILLSVKFFAPNENLVKEVFYSNEKISMINYYEVDKLASKEIYNGGVINSRLIYNVSSQQLVSTVNYSYDDFDRLISVENILGEESVKVIYKYDEIGRLSQRILYKNNGLAFKQVYAYDILDHLVNYDDGILHIEVNNVNPEGSLLSYNLSDSQGNIIKIENYISGSGYICTQINLNGYKFSVKDVTYVNDFILLKPVASEQDLNNVMNYFSNEKNLVKKTLNHYQAMRALSNSEQKILPISMRKSHLYKIA